MATGNFLEGLLGSLGNSGADPFLALAGSVVGNKSNQTSKSTGSSSFDMSKLPDFLRQMAEYERQTQSSAGRITERNRKRQMDMQRRLNEQLAAIRGIGDQEVSNINTRYDSMQGGVGQKMASRGLYNSSVRPGMGALVERERNRAVGNQRDRQKQIIGGLLGSQAEKMDSLAGIRNQLLAGLDLKSLDLRSLVPQGLGRSTKTKNKTKQKQKSGLLGLF